MTDDKLHIFLLCFFVFGSLVVLFTWLFCKLMQAHLHIIKLGVEDDSIIEEFSNDNPSKCHVKISYIETIFVSLIWLIFLVALGVSLYMFVTEDNSIGDVPVIKVVKSESMSVKAKGNDYLDGLDNQVAKNDLILLHRLPKAEDIALYDIVLYEKDGILILHRVVGIIDDVDGSRRFIMQGDAVARPDNDAVEYSEMRGIYRNVKVPRIGSFIRFMQSPAGFLCLLLVGFVTVTIPLIDKKIAGARYARMVELDIIATIEDMYAKGLIGKKLHE